MDVPCCRSKKSITQLGYPDFKEKAILPANTLEG